MEARYVAYLRVSTDRQGQSGLGLDAQAAAVALFVSGRGGSLVADFIEVESGRKDNRPKLAEAIAACRQHRAVLVIAKLDRLARNVAFIANLMESGVEFCAVDMPDANKLSIHILAAVAEHEREMISKRTKEALAAAKARGVKLGNPNPRLNQPKASQKASELARAHREAVRPAVLALREQGMTLRQIADEMNRRGVPTLRGKSWKAQTVRRIAI